MTISYGKQSIDSQDIRYVVKSLKSNYLTYSICFTCKSNVYYELCKAKIPKYLNYNLSFYIISISLMPHLQYTEYALSGVSK